MEIRKFTRKTLEDFLNSALFGNLEQIPISRHRAMSHINNPRCSDNDVILVIALEGNQLTGYLGVLPDYVYNVGEKIRIGWLSCFWVDESQRSTPLAATLLLEVMDSWDHQIMITNFVPALEPLYRKTGFFRPAMVKEGIRAYMRSNLAEILPPKATWLKRIRPLLKFTDISINVIGSTRFLFFRGYRLHYLNWSFIDLIDENISAFIKANNNSWTWRGRADLQWILDYPWIIQKPNPDYDSIRYFFSSVSVRFLNRLILVSDHHGHITGFAMITIRNNNMTVPYVFSVNGYDHISDILINVMIDQRVSMITVFHDELRTTLKSYSIPFLYKKSIPKPYMVSKKLDFLNELRFNDGDGDCAFY